MASSIARNLCSHLSKAISHSRRSPSVSLHHRTSVLYFSSASQGKEEHRNKGYGLTDDSGGGDHGVRTQATEVTREGPGKMSEVGYKMTQNAEEGAQRAADKATGFGETVADGPGKAWDAAKGTAEKVKGSVEGGVGKAWEAAKGTAQKVKESVVGKSEVDDRPIEDYIEDHVGKPVKKKAMDADVDLKDKEGAYDSKH